MDGAYDSSILTSLMVALNTKTVEASSSEATLDGDFDDDDALPIFNDPSRLSNADDTRTADELARQRKILEGYAASVPYKIETEAEMQPIFDDILGRLVIAAETRDWIAFAGWDNIVLT